MSGKRAKASPWRFLRFAPLALVTVVVWVTIGLFLLFPGSGDHQADDWGLDPIPSGGTEPEETTAPAPQPADSSGPTATTETPSPASAPRATPSPVADSFSSQPPATRPPTTSSPTTAPTAPSPRPTTDPTVEPSTQPSTQSEPVSEQDSPGKRRGHHDGRGPNDDR
jgi:hypothetical protein